MLASLDSSDLPNIVQTGSKANTHNGATIAYPTLVPTTEPAIIKSVKGDLPGTTPGQSLMSTIALSLLVFYAKYSVDVDSLFTLHNTLHYFLLLTACVY